MVCVELGVRKTMEIEQKGVKWGDASGMAVRHAEAVSAEEEQQWLGAKAPGSNVLLEGAGNHGENLECRIPGASRRNEREDAHGRTKEDKVREQKKKKTKKMMMMTYDDDDDDDDHPEDDDINKVSASSLERRNETRRD